ncbi:nucleotidyltransferase domain-containing protein [Candidatus Pacearchaeota archaeon]|nr:nucleotidyltransferase domain-containing protein [Candidatus Pacearchaeota archaeon]
MNHRNLLKSQIIEKINNDKKIIAVLLFGSYARGENYRDIDICIVLDKKYSGKEMFKEAVKYSSLLPDKFDVKIFQQLPVYIRKRILEEGKILICKNEELLYEIAFSTIKEFDDFKEIYRSYIKNALK